MIRVTTLNLDGRIAVEVRQEHPRGSVTVNLPQSQREAAQVFDALVHELDKFLRQRDVERTANERLHSERNGALKSSGAAQKSLHDALAEVDRLTGILAVVVDQRDRWKQVATDDTDTAVRVLRARAAERHAAANARRTPDDALAYYGRSTAAVLDDAADILAGEQQ